MEEKVEKTVNEIVKQKRPKRSEQLQPQMEKGEMRQYIRHSLASWDLPPINIADIEQVNERIGWYFQHCVEDDMKPTVMGLCNALGIDRKTFYEWSIGKNRSDSHTPSIKKAKNFLEEMMESYMLNGKINPVSGIFLLKNNFGYQDKQEVVLTPNNPLGEQTTPEELQQKYLDATASDFDEDE